MEPRTGITPCYSGLQEKGTATSPLSTAKPLTFYRSCDRLYSILQLCIVINRHAMEMYGTAEKWAEKKHFIDSVIKKKNNSGDQVLSTEENKLNLFIILKGGTKSFNKHFITD